MDEDTCVFIITCFIIGLFASVVWIGATFFKHIEHDFRQSNKTLIKIEKQLEKTND